MTKLILDTNFYIGLALKGKFYIKLFDYLTLEKAQEIELLMSDTLFHEIKAKLFTEKTKKYIPDYNQDTMVTLLEKIKSTHTLINPVRKIEIIHQLKDPQDLFLFELAEQESAHYILSNDKIVRKIGKYKTTKIFKFQEFFGQL